MWRGAISVCLVVSCAGLGPARSAGYSCPALRGVVQQAHYSDSDCPSSVH